MKTTKQEQDLILDMLASGRINAAEATSLFDAIELYGDEEIVEDPAEDYDFSGDWIPDLRYEIQHAMDTIRFPIAVNC